MKYTEFGSQKAQVSEIMLGLWRFAEVSPGQIAELVGTCVECGINSLDIADIYGEGRCEELLGEAFALRPGLRDKIFLQTKVGIRKDAQAWYDFSKEHIIAGVDACLKRMGTDHVESLLLHRPDLLMEPEEVAEAFTQLHAAGKVLDFGVSNMNPATMRLLRKWLPFPLAANQMQLSAAFTPAFDAALYVNRIEDYALMRDGGVFEYCRENDMVIQTWSSLQVGYEKAVMLGHKNHPQLNAVLSRMAEEKGTTPTAIALAWILRYPAKMQAIIGTSKAGRIREAAASCDITLTRREWYEIYQTEGRRCP